MVGWERSTKARAPSSPGVTQAGASCEIRALDSVADLIESYRLRYEVYGALGYLQQFNESRLEIDEYDESAIPFGAFDTGSGHMIGTLRLITLEPQPDYAQLVRRVVGLCADPALSRQTSGPRHHPLPSIISPDIERRIAAFNRDNFVVQELSRTIVRPGYRGGGVSRGLMELGLAYAAQQSPSVLIGGCATEHVPMYARYGYTKLPDSGMNRYDSVGVIAHAVVCRTDVLPQPTRAQVDELLRVMSAGGSDRTLEIGKDSRAIFRFSGPRRPRRRTIEW